MIDPALRQQARDLFVAGLSTYEIARQLDLKPPTVQNWQKIDGWQVQRSALMQSQNDLLRNIALLSQIKKPNEKTARALDKLTTAYERLQKISTAQQVAAKRKGKVAKPAERQKYLDKVLSDDYGLYRHQQEFLLSDARFRVVLKARQVGYSYVLALDALLTAIGGTDAMIVSASKDQADIVIDHAYHHVDRLGLEVISAGGSEILLGNGAKVFSRPSNFRTTQGPSGTLYLDEFAWVQNQKRLWEATVPIITAAKGRVVVSSTPYEKGSLFYRIAENVDNRFPRFWRQRVSIDDAIINGMPVDLAELQDLFDADSFARLYRLNWFDDEESYFSFDEINACARVDCLRHTTDAVLYGGLDVGRTRDASEIILVEADSWNDDDGPVIDDAVIIRVTQTLRRASFDSQIATVRALLHSYRIKRFTIDATGIGMQLAETLQKEFPGVVNPIWLTRDNKEEMAITLKQLFEKRRIIIPNDPVLIAQINSIKRIPKERGFSYDSARNAEIGHADKFWALALACKELDSRGQQRVVVTLF